MLGMQWEAIVKLNNESQSTGNVREARTFAKDAGEMLVVRESRGKVGDRTPTKNGA